MNRYYDPVTGEFVTIDPDVAKTGVSYAYAGEDPTNETDPAGLIPNLAGEACAGQIKPPKGVTQEQFCQAMQASATKAGIAICAIEKGFCSGGYGVDLLIGAIEVVLGAAAIAVVIALFPEDFLLILAAITGLEMLEGKG